ncbi:MAG: hypothetical protein JKY65_07405 [Planctomycetes bacterium]|nr:hypothetical protein [Planctomycetota bacterium]
MTRPRPVFKNSVSFLTRRVVGQQFLLRPDAVSANAYRYSLALSARKFNWKVQYYAAQQMSNHDHSVLFDEDAVRSEYLSHKNSVLARSMNALRKRKGVFWEATTTKDKIDLRERHEVLSSIVYTLCNPVAANLCDYPHEWPGTVGDWRQLLTVPITATRPLHFFNQAPPDKGGTPVSVLFYLSKPGCFGDLTKGQYEELIRGAVQEECERLHALREGPSLGAEAALRLDPSTVPFNLDTEIDRDYKRFRGDPESVGRLAEAWIAWVAAYMEARRRWRRGERQGVVFPPGTDAYRRLEDAPTAPLDPDSPFAFQHT